MINVLTEKLKKAGVEVNVSEHRPVFYSNALRAVEAIAQEKATPAQWLAMIQKNGGIKAGEDKWLGLSDWLKQSTEKTIGKEDIREYILSHGIEIAEDVFYDMFSNDENLEALKAEYQELVNEGEDATGSLFYSDYYNYAFKQMTERYGRDFYNGFEKGENGELYVYAEEPAARVLNLLAADKRRLRYTTNYLDNKKELAFWVPDIKPWKPEDQIHFGQVGDGRCIGWVRFGETKDVYTYSNAERREMLDKMPRAEEWQKVVSNRKYANVNWYPPKTNEKYPDACISVMNDNYWVWGVEDMKQKSYASFEDAVAAFNEHVVPTEEVKRILVLDEIQSNRHQVGRSLGYRMDDKEKMAHGKQMADVSREKEALQKALKEKYKCENFSKHATSEELERLEECSNRLSELFKQGLKRTEGAEPAPFEKNWQELFMKRMLRYAVENGFDTLTWTTGEQQAVRYDVGQVVERYSSEPYQAQSPQEVDGYDVDVYTNAGKIVLFVDKNGTICSGEVNGQNNFVGQPLEKLVGSRVAETILSSTEPIYAKYLDKEFRFGYEGMHKFYDEMLPSFVNKYCKKWGAQVEEMELFELERRECNKHGIHINEAMRKDIMQGQPMFMKGKEGEVYGCAIGDSIWMAPDSVKPETLVHEYTHVWATAMQHGNPEGWQSVKDLLRGTPLWEQVRQDPHYRDIAHNEDYIASEALARISGKEGEARMQRMMDRIKSNGSGQDAESVLERLQRALQAFWSWIGKHMLDIKHFHSVNEVTDRVLYDLLAGQALEKVQPLHFAPPLDTSRISHVVLYKGLHDQPYIRCKVDGVQQMGKPVKPQDSGLSKEPDGLLRLAGTYFKAELQQERQHTLKR